VSLCLLVVACEASYDDIDALENAQDQPGVASAACQTNGGQPLIAIPGIFGSDELFKPVLGAAAPEMYKGVVSHLTKKGQKNVFVVDNLTPYTDVESQGKEAVKFIEAVLARDDVIKTTCKKAVLIGQSQGGLTARWVAARYPHLVAAVVTYATPNRGTPLADMLTGTVPDKLKPYVDGLIRLFTALIFDGQNGRSKLLETAKTLTMSAVANFNIKYPRRRDIAYYSIAVVGNGPQLPFVANKLGIALDPLTSPSSPSMRGICAGAAPDAPSFVADWAHTPDETSAPMQLSHGLIQYWARSKGAHSANDGFIRTIDQEYGTFLGCVPADHLKEVGHYFPGKLDVNDLFALPTPLIGVAPGPGKHEFNHLRLFEELAVYLRITKKH
jgi:pimeloyl-ACP methyl ester carboxylesterase